MPYATVKYKYGSGKANTSTSAGVNAEGKSESAVLNALKKKHSNIKNLEIIIVEIKWKD
ncbi:MAG: hypothetical protein N3A69_05155 [Leptospiraceae bacterium]|nr:hypothetical protein [Leptospiraceae bacterium]